MRDRLRLNAGFSLISGVATLALAPSISRAVGLDSSTLVRVVGGALVVFAVDVAVLSRTRRRHLVVGAKVVVIADALWVTATLLTVLLSNMPPRGVALLGSTSLLVAGLAGIQLLALQNDRDDGSDGLERLDQPERVRQSP